MKRGSKSGQGIRSIFCCLCVIAAALFLVLPLTSTMAAVPPLTIDHFFTTQSLKIDNSSGGAIPGTDPPKSATSNGSSIDCLGNTRHLLLWLTQAPASLPDPQALDISGSVMRYSLKDGADGNGTIIYSGDAAGVTLNLGLNAIPYNRFVLELVSADFPGDVSFDLHLKVTSEDGTKTASITRTIGPPLQLHQVFLFSAFGGDLSVFEGTIGKLEMYWNNGPLSLDWSLDEIFTDCNATAPNVTSFFGNPTIITTLPSSTTLTWESTNALSGKIVSNCGDSPTTTPVAASGSQSFPVTQTPPCTFTFTAIGECDNDTAVVTISQQPSRVPSLNEWGMIILSLVLAGSAVWLLRRRRNS